MSDLGDFTEFDGDDEGGAEGVSEDEGTPDDGEGGANETCLQRGPTAVSASSLPPRD